MGDHYGNDSHKRRWELNTKLLSDVLGAERSQLYSLYHAMGIYENQRATSSDKRVVNLTRSSYAGQRVILLLRGMAIPMLPGTLLPG